MPLAQVSASFQSLPPLSTNKLGPSGADSQVGGLVCVLGLWVSPTNFPVRLGVFPTAISTCTSVFSESFEALFSCPGTLGCTVCLEPQLFLAAYLPTNVRPPVLPAATSPAQVLQPPPCCKSSPPFLLVWMNVSSTLWLSDFHIVRFSVSSDCFLFLNLLSFFWLCRETQCIYLCLHLCRKSEHLF